jgi:hypothetical protein
MNTKVGVGSSNKTNSKTAGIEASTRALDELGSGVPGFALIFCSGKHNPYDFLEGVCSVLGDSPKVGGSGIGIITNDFLSYEGFEVAVTVFHADHLNFKTFAQPDINDGELQAGEALGRQIADAASDTDQALLVFYDSSNQQNPPMLNFATWLFEGIEKHLPSHLSCAGAGLLADMQLSTTYQFFNNEVRTQNAVSVLIGGKCTMHTTIMHGCRPASSYLTITSTSGPVVAEIENRPALEVIDELTGKDHGMKWKDFSLFVTLGVNRGDKFGPFDEKNYANRLTLAVDEATKSLIMFEPDLKAGDEVQLMRRSVDLH